MTASGKVYEYFSIAIIDESQDVRGREHLI